MRGASGEEQLEMAATIIDGHAVAERIRTQVREQAAEMRAHGRQLKLAAVLVGELSLIHI